MSENTSTATSEPITAEKKKDTPPPPCSIVVPRNEVFLPFKHHKILKGKRADTYYPAPEVTAANKSLVEKWLGESNVLNILQTYVKRACQNISADSVNTETGLFDETLFIKYAQDLTSTGMKLKEINDKLEELQALQVKLIDGGLWATDDKVKNEMLDLNKQILAYRQMREDKQRKPKVEDEEEAPSVNAES